MLKGRKSTHADERASSIINAIYRNTSLNEYCLIRWLNVCMFSLIYSRKPLMEEEKQAQLIKIQETIKQKICDVHEVGCQLAMRQKMQGGELRKTAEQRRKEKED